MAIFSAKPKTVTTPRTNVPIQSTAGAMPQDVIEQMLTRSKAQLAVVEQNFKAINVNLDEIREQLNDHTKALTSIYRVLELLAQHDAIQIPPPLVDMSIETEDKPKKKPRFI